MTAHLKRLVEALTRADIEWAVGPTLLQKLERIVDTTDPRSISWGSILLAVEGQALLSNPKVRYLLLRTLSDERLRDLAARFTKKVHDKSSDNALVLSHLPWRSRSAWMYAAARSLNLDPEYLPATHDASPNVEVVEPHSAIHPMHPYQIGLKDSLLASLKGGADRVLLQLPTGAGKTRTTIESLLDLDQSNRIFESGRSILWLAHSEELCEQAIDGFRDVWEERGSYPVQVVRAWGGHNVDEYEWRHSFVVATFQRMHSLFTRHHDRFVAGAESLALIVIDEAHKVLAPTYSEVVEECARFGAQLFGLTATPGRGVDKDKENEGLARFFNRNLIAPDLGGNVVEKLRDLGYLARLDRRSISSGLSVRLSEKDMSAVEDDLPSGILAKLADSVGRNRLIVSIIGSEVAAGNPCLVFACSVEHSRVLSAVLNLRGCRACSIDCNMSRGSRREAIARFKAGLSDVIVNFGVLSTGFDAPGIRTVVITRPTSSVVLYSQMIGRGLRGVKMGGSATCNLIDIRDNFENFGDVDSVYECFACYWT